MIGYENPQGKLFCCNFYCSLTASMGSSRAAFLAGKKPKIMPAPEKRFPIRTGNQDVIPGKRSATRNPGIFLDSSGVYPHEGGGGNDMMVCHLDRKLELSPVTALPIRASQPLCRQTLSGKTG